MFEMAILISQAGDGLCLGRPSLLGGRQSPAASGVSPEPFPQGGLSIRSSMRLSQGLWRLTSHRKPPFYGYFSSGQFLEECSGIPPPEQLSMHG